MRRIAVAVFAVALFAPQPAEASFHFMRIVEVYGGSEAAPNAQYVVLQMYSGGQNFVGTHAIIVYDAEGGAFTPFTFGADVSNGTNQAKILIATSAAQTFFGITPDLIMQPMIGWGGGKICWDATLVDCVAWGGYNGNSAGVGTPFGAPAGIPRGQAIHRSLGMDGILQDTDDTGNSAADFFAGPPTPVNNAGASGIIPASVCGNGTLEGLEGCDDGNTANGDGCSSVCKLEIGGTSAQALSVDPTAGGNSNGNGVFDPGESVLVNPTWKNLAASTRPLFGSISNVTAPGGMSLISPDGNAGYGTLASNAMSDCLGGSGDCYQIFGFVFSRPSLHVDATVNEVLNNGDLKAWTFHVGGSFTDVSVSSGFYRFIETILHKGVTAGCGGTNYCPSSSVTREQMAVFVLVSKEGAGYTPPTCGTPIFADVPASSGFCRFIEELANRGVVAGCGGGNYCPSSAVTREQMAVFLLRTLDPVLNPPACTMPTIFADVPVSSPFCRWVEELSRRGITAGCGGSNYCPTNPVTRQQMAVFLTTTFSLLLYGP